MNKKFIFIGAGALVLILIIVLVATSCGGTKQPVVAGSNTLTIWGFDDPTLYGDVISDFQTKNPTYKVTYVKKDPADYETAALSEIAAGKGPDVWAIPNNWVPKFQDKLVAMPSTLIANKKAKKTNIEVYKTLFPNVVAQDNIIGDNIYGMPLSIDTLVLFYNKKILNKTVNDYFAAGNKDVGGVIGQKFAQGPINWDDFVTMTKLITKKDGKNITQSAVALGTSGNVNQATDILTLLMMQDGAKMTSDDLSTAQFHTKQNVFGGQDFPGAQALNFYTAFANPQTDLYTWNSSIEDSLHAFAEGKTAMMIDYTSQEAEVTRINPNLSFNYFAMPQVKETKNEVNYASYMTFTVTKASKAPNIAWQFINSLTNSNKTPSYVSKMKKQPVQLVAITANSKEGKRILNAQDWYNPDPAKIKTIFSDSIQQVNDGKNPQTAIEYAGSQITTLLGKLKQ